MASSLIFANFWTTALVFFFDSLESAFLESLKLNTVYNGKEVVEIVSEAGAYLLLYHLLNHSYIYACAFLLILL
jgi:hypothetical protein